MNDSVPASIAPLVNLFADLATARPSASAGGEERFDLLLETASLRVERIVSQGHASPAGFWYDQPQAEWVALLRGAARLLVEGAANPVELRPGDCLLLHAHVRHRVEWTTPDEPTVWLAIFYAERLPESAPPKSP